MNPNYTIAANAMLPVLIKEIRANVPNWFDYQGKAMEAAPGLAGELAKAAVDGMVAAHSFNAKALFYPDTPLATAQANP